MQEVIYAGLRNAARDQLISAALLERSAVDVAEEFRLSPSAVYSARRRIDSLKPFSLILQGGG